MPASSPSPAGWNASPTCPGRGFNELRVEDKRGEEEIYLHAEKDVNAYVKNDVKEHVLRDRHETTDNFTYLETKGETHETLRD